MSQPLNVLSFGAGAQSTAVLLMSCLGELPKLDCAIFADTGWEPKAVYRQFEWAKGVAERHGIPVQKVSNGNIRSDMMRAYLRKEDHSNKDGGRWANMPFFTKDKRTGKVGLTRRQCTNEYKITPIEKFIKTELLGLKPRGRWPIDVAVRHWFGISADETGRISQPAYTKTVKRPGLFGEVEEKVSVPIRWKANVYPLIGVELRGTWERLRINEHWMDREACVQWTADHGFPAAPKSACIGCPFHGEDMWQAMKESEPEDWEDACQFDDAIRDRGGMRGQLFLHRSCTPLRDVDFTPLVQLGGVLQGCETGYCMT